MPAAFGEPADEDAYDLLDVRPDASAEEIKKAWRRLARDRHPDTVAGGPEAKAAATERFQRLNAAYTVLTRDRAAYDAHRRSVREAAEDAGEDGPAPTVEEVVDDPWDAASPGAPGAPPAPGREADPWDSAAPGAPPPPTYPPPHRHPPPPRSPFPYVPPSPTHQAAPQRRRKVVSRLGIGCAVLWAGFWFLVASATLLSAVLDDRPSAEVAVPTALAGTWKGKATDRGAEHSEWDVELTLEEGKKDGEIRYLHGKCAGTAVPLTFSDRTLTVRTDFSDDASDCDVGDMHLTRRKGGKADLVYYDSGKKTKSASGVLYRD
ncbi:J domain-containing protein [Actinomadura violacea]|uniref:J domain-containing protein n=1 Tax=Actinomadura violacea TaxID=2819934 RepID=UPI0027DB8306|nr:J domain-containing protein [Actinomadura violacea]